MVTAASADILQKTLMAIEQATQCELLVLPMEKSFHIDLAFPIDFSAHSDNILEPELVAQPASLQGIA